MEIIDNIKSLHSKYKNGEMTWTEYNNELVKRRGYENLTEYQNELVKKKGYENFREYRSKMNYKKGIGTGLSMSENKDCAAYLGVLICENKEFLSKIVNIIESMSYGNPGYDIICGKGKKIDVKCSCLSSNNTWDFSILKNKIPDYFLCISFDNRKNLNVQHIWLVKGNAVIEKTNIYNSKEFVVNEKDIIHIGKGNKALKRWIKHEITDTYKLKEIRKVCDCFKDNNGDLNE